MIKVSIEKVSIKMIVNLKIKTTLTLKAYIYFG